MALHVYIATTMPLADHFTIHDLNFDTTNFSRRLLIAFALLSARCGKLIAFHCLYQFK